MVNTKETQVHNLRRVYYYSQYKLILLSISHNLVNEGQARQAVKMLHGPFHVENMIR